MPPEVALVPAEGHSDYGRYGLWVMELRLVASCGGKGSSLSACPSCGVLPWWRPSAMASSKLPNPGYTGDHTERSEGMPGIPKGNGEDAETKRIIIKLLFTALTRVITAALIRLIDVLPPL
jgi:hypothetical protein